MKKQDYLQMDDHIQANQDLNYKNINGLHRGDYIPAKVYKKITLINESNMVMGYLTYQREIHDYVTDLPFDDMYDYIDKLILNAVLKQYPKSTIKNILFENVRWWLRKNECYIYFFPNDIDTTEPSELEEKHYKIVPISI